MNAPLPVITHRCDRCNAPDDSKCGCPDFFSRPEVIEAAQLLRAAELASEEEGER